MFTARRCARYWSVWALLLYACSEVECTMSSSTTSGEWYGSQMMDPEMRTFLQPNRVGRDLKYDDFSTDDGYLCTRDCCKYPRSRLCYFQFTAEQYAAMGPACKNCASGNRTECSHAQCITADGIERMVCRGDRIVIDVSNMMTSAALAIHWHGIPHRTTPWMDGMPFVTQCPIAPMGGLFRYDYWAENVGTFFYHSHSGRLQGDGIYGALVVRGCDGPNRYLYDHDQPSHTLVIADWNHYPSDIYFPGYYLNVSHVIIKPDAYLINGLGSYEDSVTKTKTPHYEVHVKSGGSRYKLRLVASTTSVCLFTIAIEDHSMTIIAMDGNPCEPKEVNSASIAAGSRIDVVIIAKPKNYHHITCSYNIVVKGMQDCENTTSVQTAYLVYDGCEAVPTSKPDFPSIYNRSPYFDDVERGCERDDVHCSYELRRVTPPEPELSNKQEPDYRFFLELDSYSLGFDELFNNITYPYQTFHVPAGGVGLKNGGIECNVINRVSSMMPWFPILYQDEPIPEDMLCDGECKKNQGFCYCINIIKVSLNSTVQFVFRDVMPMDGPKRHHPMHIHGVDWVVLKQGYVAELERNPEGYYLNAGDHAVQPSRDTVVIPDGGFAVVEFWASNPGMWMMHCHFEEHLLTGMYLIIQVGEREQFLTPPDDFPRCSGYLPKITNLNHYKYALIDKHNCSKSDRGCVRARPNKSPPPSFSFLALIMVMVSL